MYRSNKCREPQNCVSGGDGVGVANTIQLKNKIETEENKKFNKLNLYIFQWQYKYFQIKELKK